MENILKKRLLFIFFAIITLFSLAFTISIGTMNSELQLMRKYLEGLAGSVYDIDLKSEIDSYNISYTCWIFQLIIGIILILVGLIGILLTWRNTNDSSKYLLINTLAILLSLIFVFTITHTLVKTPIEDRGPISGEIIVSLIFSYMALVSAFCLYFLNPNYKYIKGSLTIIVFLLIFIVCSIDLSASSKNLTEAHALGVISPIYDKTISADVFLLLLSIIGLFSPVIFMLNYDSISFETKSSSTTKKEQTCLTSVDDKLRSLKKLLDDGIISEEEYQEKRKKYVDML